MDVQREWLDLVAHLLTAPLTELPEERLATALMATFDAPACAFHHRPGPGMVVQRVYPEGLFDAAQQAEWVRLAAEAPGYHPLLHYYLRTGDQRPHQVADVPSAFGEQGVLGWWVELGRCQGYEHQLAIPLPPGPEGLRWFVVGRDTAYGPDRMVLARRVQRLIIGLDRQAATLRHWQDRAPVSGSAVSVHRARPDVPLTPRELAVLTLVADGLTAAAAARRLVVAERTVHKHLERAYAKLGVSDRVSAVLRAQQLGILGAPRARVGAR